MLTQVVVHFMASAEPELMILENPSGVASISFQEAQDDYYVPRLGTQDLLKLAHYAAHHGWEIDKLELQDSVTAASLDEQDEERISESILRHLGSESLTRLIEYFIDRFPTVNVIGVEFVREDHRAVTLRRNGVAIAEDGVSPLEVLSPAWHQLQLA